MKIAATDVVVAILVLAVIMLIIVPISTGVMDALLVISLTLSLLMLLMALYIKNALEVSIFPTMLLLLTVFRLALNLSSTKLILENNGNAGNVIKTFGEFVAGGNLVIGLIIFFLIVLIQFLVITKGAERVAEVAARFTLDAMPGKQMAIDADLNTGVINETEAQQRRKDIQRQSDFYGAMDGAMKFVKGDAIMSIITTFVNIIGGFIIGATGFGGAVRMPLDQVFSVYTLASVGDGLCTQIPALLVSVAAGIIVTRSAGEQSFGQDLIRQLLGKPSILYLLGGMVTALSFIPGFPKIPMFMIAAALIGSAYYSTRSARKEEEDEVEETAELMAQEKRKPESVTQLLQVELIQVHFGYALLSLIDNTQGGDLLDRVVMIRRQCALELGVIVPVIHLQDSIQLGSNGYSFKIKGLEVAQGKVMLDHYLALMPADTTEPIEGIESVDPAFGLPAVWVTESNREKAELKGYTTIDVPSVISTHLMEVIKRHAHELLGRQQVQILIDNLKSTQPALVEEVVPKLFSIGEVQKVLSNLLRENVSIRDLASILEILGDYGTITRDLDVLTEYVRQSMKRTITQRFVPNGKARVITLDPALEQTIAESIRQTETGSYAALEPNQMQRILLNTKSVVEHSVSNGVAPMIMTSPRIRKHFKRLTEQLDPDLVVLSYNELDNNVEIYSDGVVSL